MRTKRTTESHEMSGLIADTPFVVIDTELTGLNERKDSIISIGAVRMKGARISLGDPFYRLIKPRRSLTRDSVVIHGIMPSEAAAGGECAEILTEFLEYSGNAVLVGHCIDLDLEFIRRELKRSCGGRIENKAVDTAALCRWIGRRHETDRNVGRVLKEPELYGLARFLGIEVTEVHDAVMDAFITAQLFQRVLPVLEKAGITTTGDLLRAGDPFGGGDRFRAAGEIGNL